MEQKSACYDYDTGQISSDGRTILARRCFCGTTVCLSPNKAVFNLYGKDNSSLL